MDSIETVCEVCHGTRYSEEVLKYQYKGKNIAEVMDMTVRQAIQFFEDEDFVKKLDTLVQVGLGYLHLNQSMTTLSGGELQRVKLASKLDERGQIFILDEPTDGLHLDDIRRLMKLFNRMTDQGNTLFIIEHSLDVMKDADYIVELQIGRRTRRRQSALCRDTEGDAGSGAECDAGVSAGELIDKEKYPECIGKCIRDIFNNT